MFGSTSFSSCCFCCCWIGINLKFESLKCKCLNGWVSHGAVMKKSKLENKLTWAVHWPDKFLLKKKVCDYIFVMYTQNYCFSMHFSVRMCGHNRKVLHEIYVYKSQKIVEQQRPTRLWRQGMRREQKKWTRVSTVELNAYNEEFLCNDIYFVLFPLEFPHQIHIFTLHTRKMM